MQFFSITNPKIFASLLLLAMLSMFTFGCQKEILNPENTQFDIQADAFNSLQRPVTQCGPSLFSTMDDGALTFGNVEVLNDNSSLYLLFDLSQNKFIEEISVFTDASSNVPLDADGDIQPERFSYHQLLNQPANDFTLTLPLRMMPTCVDIVIRARITTRNMFGQVTATNFTWLAGTPLYNGFSAAFCVTSCATGNGGPAIIL